MQGRLTDALGLPEERQRLVRFCTHLAGGDTDAAEDIAQETLMEAWRRRDALRNPAAWRSYLYGIAQNVYRRRGRSTARERTRLFSYNGTRSFYLEGPAGQSIEIIAIDGSDYERRLREFGLL